jgi:hypothetical protein
MKAWKFINSLDLDFWSKKCVKTTSLFFYQMQSCQNGCLDKNLGNLDHQKRNSIVNQTDTVDLLELSDKNSYAWRLPVMIGFMKLPKLHIPSTINIDQILWKIQLIISVEPILTKKGHF